MPTVKYINPQENNTVRAISNLIRAGEGTPEIGFSTNLGTESDPMYRSGSGWVKNYFTTNSVGDIIREAVPKSGLTEEQNSLSLDAAGAFYRQMMYDRFPVFAKHMPIGAMAVYSDVAHHGRQEHNKSPKWDEDNRMVWAARTGNKEAKEYLGKRGYKGADFSEVAARQLLDYYSDDGGKNRIYDRMIHRFDALRSKLPVNARPWDYFGADYSGPRDEVEKGLRKAWDKINRQAAKGGNAPGESKSSGVPSGHNPALDGYQGPRIVVNPTTFRNSKDAACVAYNEAIRVFMEANGYEPQSEPTEKQRQFFADTPYADDELQLRRTILARICVFDTSVKDPTDDQLSESAQILRSIIDSGFAKTDDEIEKCERLARAIEAAVGAEPVEPREEPLRQAPLQPNEETQAADKAGETEEEALKRLAGGDTGSTVQEDTSTLEEREKFLEDRGMDKSLAETGSMDTLVKMHEQETQGTVGAEQLQAEQTAASQQGQPQVGQAGAQPQQEQQVAVAQPQQETLAPGLSRSGSRNNILEYEGRRISQREFDRIQAKFQEGGPQQPTGIGGRTLTAGEAAWQAKRQASTEAWMQRTGQNAVADAGLPEAQPNAEPREEMDGLGGEGGGLVKSGSRGNILTYKGRRTTDREARRLGLI